VGLAGFFVLRVLGFFLWGELLFYVSLAAMKSGLIGEENCILLVEVWHRSTCTSKRTAKQRGGNK
jgi:hypothetical protein